MNIVKTTKTSGNKCVIELSIILNSIDLTCNKHLTIDLDLCTEETERKDSSTTISNFVSKFENYTAGYAKKDKKMVRACLKKFRLYSQLSKNMGNVLTKEQCIGFKDFLYESLNGNTPANYFKKFRIFLDDLVEKGEIEFNPAAGIKLSHSDYREKNVLTEAEIQKLENTHCKNDAVKQAFLFSCFSGLRWCDVCTLSAGDINLDNRSMTVLQKKVAGHSSKAFLHTYLNDSAIAIIKSSSYENMIFKLPSYAAAYNSIKQWVSGAGIKKYITFHCTRYMYAAKQAIYLLSCRG